MEERTRVTDDRPPDPRRPDGSTWVVTGVVAVGGLVYVSLGGLSAPPAAVLTGMALYLVAMAETVRRLRSGDTGALAVPALFLVAWTAALFLGMLLLGWTP